jgi:hypothetical protein
LDHFDFRVATPFCDFGEPQVACYSSLVHGLGVTRHIQPFFPGMVREDHFACSKRALHNLASEPDFSETTTMTKKTRRRDPKRKPMSQSQLAEELPRVLSALGRDAIPADWANAPDQIDERALLTLVGDTARSCGYVGTEDPPTALQASRVLRQLARDHLAQQLTRNLPSKLVPHGFTLGNKGYILYLRSFGAPLTTPIVPTDWGQLSLEEILTFYCENGSDR